MFPTGSTPWTHVPRSGRADARAGAAARSRDRPLELAAGTSRCHGRRPAGGATRDGVRRTGDARPRGARLPRKERRAQLLESALEVFVAQGYHAAAMDDIAERAGVSKPVLYQHFPGKLELYLALLDASCDEIIDNCRAALDSTHDNKLRVAAAMEAFYEYIAGDDGAFRLVFESDLTNEPAVRAAVDRVTNECAAMITARHPRRHRPARRGRPGCSPSRSWEWPRSARGSG